VQTALTAAVQKEIRAMAIDMLRDGHSVDRVREAMKNAVLLFRELQADSAAPAKVTK
jgi:hypothetical protein